MFSPIQNLSVLGTVITSDQKNGYDAWAPDNNKNFVTYADELGEDSQKYKGWVIAIKLSAFQEFVF